MSRRRTLHHSQQADTLLVLLPGAYMRPQDFIVHGFFEAVETRRLALDLAAVDIDLTGISAEEAMADLEAEVLAPARRDYRQLWLGGISLGGQLSLCYAADHAGAIDGLCLLAPYPGSRLTTNTIHRAGGLSAWQPSNEEHADPEFRMYEWLRQPPADLPVFIGYGTEDRFAEGMQTIAQCFPEASRHTRPGNHDWPVWQALWADFLETGHFPVQD